SRGSARRWAGRSPGGSRPTPRTARGRASDGPAVRRSTGWPGAGRRASRRRRGQSRRRTPPPPPASAGGRPGRSTPARLAPGGRRALEALGVEPAADEAIHRVEAPCRVGDRRRGRGLDGLERPVLAVLVGNLPRRPQGLFGRGVGPGGPILDPGAKERDLVVG